MSESHFPEGATRVLDHGYVLKIEHWGSDERIIESARMSTNKGFQGWGPLPSEVCRRCGQSREFESSWCEDSDGPSVHVYEKPGDERLLAYLWRNRHTTPFEMAGLTIEVQAPIFVFREWHRHRTQSYNEMSARYTALPYVDFRPSFDEVMQRAHKVSSNKQAQGTGALLSGPDAASWLAGVDDIQRRVQEHYEQGLAIGVPKELARIVLTMARYSRMRASTDLWNWFGFLTLRTDPHAQFEIRIFADTVAKIIEECFPRSYELWHVSYLTGRQSS